MECFPVEINEHILSFVPDPFLYVTKNTSHSFRILSSSVLKLHKHFFVMDDFLKVVADHGTTDLLKGICEELSIKSKKHIGYFCAYYGDLEKIKICFSGDTNWNTKATAYAISGKQLEIIQWAYYNGFSLGNSLDVCKMVAYVGNTEMMIWCRENGFYPPEPRDQEKIFLCAILGKNLAMVKLIDSYREHSIITKIHLNTVLQAQISTITMLSSVEIAEWIFIQHDCRLVNLEIAKNNNRSVYRLLFSKRELFEKDFSLEITVENINANNMVTSLELFRDNLVKISKYAIYYDKLFVLEYLRDLGYHFKSRDLLYATKYGKFEILKWIYQYQQILQPRLFEHALGIRRLDIMSWLVEKGCIYYTTTNNVYGRMYGMFNLMRDFIRLVDIEYPTVTIDILKFLISKQCLIPDETIDHIVEYGDFETFRWLYYNDFDDYIISRLDDLLVISGNSYDVRIRTFLKELKKDSTPNIEEHTITKFKQNKISKNKIFYTKIIN